MRNSLTADTQTSFTVRGGGEVSGWYLLRVTALAMAIALFLFTGIAIASADADPDNFLYPVKLFLEDARASLEFDPAARAGIETAHADARL